jgi:hypothetical protein
MLRKKRQPLAEAIQFCLPSVGLSSQQLFNLTPKRSIACSGCPVRLRAIKVSQECL